MWICGYVCARASDRVRFKHFTLSFSCSVASVYSFHWNWWLFHVFKRTERAKKKNAYKIAICNLFVFHVLWTSKKNDSFHVDQFFVLLFIFSWFFFIVCCMQIRWNHAQRPKLPVKLSVSNRLVVWYFHWYIHWYIPYIKKISCFQSPDYYHKWRSLTANCLNISEYRVHQ